MEDLWKRAKSFAEEAAKKSQTLTSTSTLSELVSETAKKSKELAAEASKTADLIKTAAIKQADQLKSLNVSDIIPPQFSSISIPNFSVPSHHSQSELEKFGLNDDLRDFVRGFTPTTFQNFPIQDEPDASDVAVTSSNVRKDLTEWQEQHATLVLTNVKEISRLRYELCPRIMKERIFWRIYFTLISSHVAPYEKKYMEEIKLKSEEQRKADEAKQTPLVGASEKTEGPEKNPKGIASKSSSAEQDLDTFLLGDLEDSDAEGADDGNESFDDDFDKIENSDVDEENSKAKAISS
ncbi:uncharacterized protein LOC101210244 [Cucumis sativus]|uniref:BSD domain-containing protein n=1 Tax=Cucumis sativus TaxID=3659 RepID=A0A0A0KUC1_CUCSA|nr:uncharacterized protein LOC101210244 [Cucumis sativus]KGN51997.1 hypothetical protein Csa_008145 [Cucumis sativus]